MFQVYENPLTWKMNSDRLLPKDMCMSCREVDYSQSTKKTEFRICLKPRENI